MEFSRPEYWSGQLSPSPGDLPNPGIKPRSPALWADSLSGKPLLLGVFLNAFSVICYQLALNWGFPGGLAVKNLPAMQKMQVQSLGWEESLEKEMAPTPVFLPEELCGQRSLAGYSPWGRKELDKTVQKTGVWSTGLGRSPGEGNGNPLQYSCLENSMDRGA